MGGKSKGNYGGGGGKGWGGKGNATLTSKGKAIVEFATPEQAVNAITYLNGQECDGRAIKVEQFTTYANSKPVKGQMSAKIYVSGLAYKTRSWKLKELISSMLQP